MQQGHTFQMDSETYFQLLKQKFFVILSCCEQLSYRI